MSRIRYIKPSETHAVREYGLAVEVISVTMALIVCAPLIVAVIKAGG